MYLLNCETHGLTRDASIVVIECVYKWEARKTVCSKSLSQQALLCRQSIGGSSKAEGVSLSRAFRHVSAAAGESRPLAASG